MLSLIRWFAKPRLNYIDMLVLASCAGLFPVLGWWVVLVAAIGFFLSVCVELAVLP